MGRQIANFHARFDILVGRRSHFTQPTTEKFERDSDIKSVRGSLMKS